MTNQSHNAKESPARIAARMMVSIEEHPDDPELAASLAQWLAASPEHVEAWERAWSTYDSIGEMFEKAKPTNDSKSKILRFVPWIAAASVAAAACIAFLFAPRIILEIRSDHLTETAEVEILTLEDGSTLTLGPESAVRV